MFLMTRTYSGVVSWIQDPTIYAGERALQYPAPVAEMEFVDEAVAPGQTYTYNIWSYDWF